MVQSPTQLTLETFLAHYDGEAVYELVAGIAVPKVSPKFFHSALQKSLLFLIHEWSQARGRLMPEWGVVLERHGEDWVPVPDLLFVSYERLPRSWNEDAPCPVPPELVIEIISPGQPFGEMLEKATDYLNAGILRVWILDPRAQTVTVFAPDSPPKSYRQDVPITDDTFPELVFSANQLFQSLGLS